MSKERPIIFNTEMIQAILDKNKYQTRRVIKPQPQPDPARIEWYGNKMGGWLPTSNSGKVGIFEPHSYKCPYGKSGDLLYVREAFQTNDKESCFYKASAINPDNYKWKPSIHMPKVAARIYLEVIDVRVERVQDITDRDALLEGCLSDQDIFEPGEIINAFSLLWESINKSRGFGWDTNPWVWVIDFNILSTIGKPETK